ncbi:NAD(P)-binding protein [Annulohypoxylon maeteangense]|uniref:NAD(P)-binding protein n=1 Tax=Annulohypoxylon maeteangense TaxID=1927788 RepID=UPI002008275C|nr:NAD(P)-binding protein [Annulohypoxylon maeteangense]KAI0886591.1 NAD(P)-binding protein [Annulohypoxylon maeteangense]
MSQFTQLFPSCPKFTDKDVPDQIGKVFIVTGGASGVGFEVSRILYEKNATVYIAARTESKAGKAINNIKQRYGSNGRLESLVLDLANPATIKPAVESFTSKEQRLDVLFNNAGVMGTSPNEKTIQGYELQMGTNALGPFLLTKLLEPILIRTAARQTSFGNVRIVWVSSMLDIGTPKGGVVWDAQTDEPALHVNMMANYMQSKAGVTFLGHEFAKRLSDKGIISMSLHPGMLKTELQRNMPAPVRAAMGMVFKGPIYGAYTELFAGLSCDITARDNGGYIIPWGRIGSVPGHMAEGMRSEEEGTGLSEKFYNWCEETMRPYQ